jgi:LacI family transcriptional regulator, galactose operon repressor
VYFADVVHGIEQAASRAGYSLLLADTHDEVANELRAVSDLLSRRVEAIILAPSADPAGAMRHAALQEVPVILIDRFTDDNVDQIAVENVMATAGLVDHLAQHGHQRIAMISGRKGLSTSEERTAGFELGLRRNDIDPRGALILAGDSRDDVAEEAFRAMLAESDPPTAVVVANNRMTIGVMRAARNAGIRIPEDLALVAFDDFEWADLFHPRLTVVAQPTLAMGQQAVELVFSRLADPARPARKVVLRPTFVHRDSCGCP